MPEKARYENEDRAEQMAQIFINPRLDRIKRLMWDPTGFALYYKQLEQGTFELPKAAQGGQMKLEWRGIALLL